MATGEPWKVLLAHLLEYWAARGSRPHGAAPRDARRRRRPPARRPRTSSPVSSCSEFVEPTGKQKVAGAVFRFPEQEIGPDLTEKRDQRSCSPAGRTASCRSATDGVDLVARRADRDVERRTPSRRASSRRRWSSTTGCTSRAKQDALEEVGERRSPPARRRRYPAIVSLLAPRADRVSSPAAGPPSGRFTADVERHRGGRRQPRPDRDGDPRATRDRQDLHGRADHPTPRRRREAGRGHRVQPRRHRQPAP